MPSMDWQKNYSSHNFSKMPDKKIQDCYLVFLLVLLFSLFNAKLPRYGN
jgi:hypothetical protein